MTIKTNIMMITAAAFITGGAAFAEVVQPAPAPAVAPSIQFLLDLFTSNDAPTVAEIEAAIAAEALRLNDPTFRPGRIYVDSDGEARVRFFVGNVQYRVRIDGDELRYKRSDDGLNDTSDANGDDTSGTSDTSDSNGDSSDDTSDSNSGSGSSND
jgi:hypothetical protein